MFRHKVEMTILALLVIVGVAAFSSKPQEYIELRANNPYDHDVYLEVKCDWNNSFKGFEYHKHFLAPQEGHTKIVIPSHHRKCEIWPKVLWFN